MHGISNEYIENAIYELVGSLGTKESSPADTVMRRVDAGKTRECFEAMPDYLGLPIVVDLQYLLATLRRPVSLLIAFAGVGSFYRVSRPGFCGTPSAKPLQTSPLNIESRRSSDLQDPS